VAPTLLVFFEPAVQHVGVHAMLPGYGSNGCPRALAGRYQFSFELGCVGTVGASGRILGEVWVFEHGVHDGLRAHDLARCENSIQDGFAGRLRRTSEGAQCATGLFAVVAGVDAVRMALGALDGHGAGSDLEGRGSCPWSRLVSPAHFAPFEGMDVFD